MKHCEMENDDIYNVYPSPNIFRIISQGNGRGKSCSTQWGKKKHTGFEWENQKQRHYLEYLGAGERIILKLILNA
jgi:hypothetical protein